MPNLPKRPRDPSQLARLLVEMASGEKPNDKPQVLQALAERERRKALQRGGQAKR